MQLSILAENRRKIRAELRLRVPGVMTLGALWQKTLAPPLPTPCQYRAATLGLHAGAESVLTFPRAL
jgi:hypothetical protein